MIAPAARSDLPVFRVERGTVVRVHLGFAAKSTNVTRNGRKVRVKVDLTARIVFWHAIGGAIVIVSAKGFGDASYVAQAPLSFALRSCGLQGRSSRLLKGVTVIVPARD